MIKLLKKLLGLIGVFKFANATKEEDKNVIAYSILHLLKIGIGLFVIYIIITLLM